MLRDDEGRIEGLQVRAMDSSTSSKYKFVSSAFKATGVSSGSVTSVVKGPNQTAFAITEGVFKAYTEAYVFRCKTLVMGGTSLQKDALTKEVVGDLTECYICYDADWDANVNVMAGLVKTVITTLESRLFKTVYVQYWDSTFGKGVDDVFLSGHLSQIKRMTAIDFLLLPQVMAYLEKLEREVKNLDGTSVLKKSSLEERAIQLLT